ncbi:NAD-dependent epimerase/dehydratase family protein [Campylobacter cuniculorum]|uniref:Nucleoside-diphosphate-sugar epimerase n=2 Tax=Campylobacter cuniculorum TaxID=374106 RepID=A0A1W6BW26_9BACT|nr:NAD-dependent epimerase/dehydratase family protein [Campylobacter cuniculorum]ARJ56271.1 nucleoside-diphosphate-sugar epimerase [Campylobacter cuniculorum DSM 23162 = LMG 24588]QOR03763.1 NAD-dependent epimerase/dehydratase family protein [Campylobacter cuniculorum]
MKILITGGAGFIGSSLGYYLSKKGYEVILIDNFSYGRLDNLVIDGEVFGEFIGLDIRSKELSSYMQDVDIVFHFAGIAALPDCQSDPYEAIDVNVAGTANVLNAARINGVKKVIFSSTSAIYEANRNFPCQESDFTNPYLIYSNSKKQAEMLCYSFFKTYGLNSVILRFFNVYGPHQDMKRKHPPLIGYILKELLQMGGGNRPILYSDGNQKRDYVYIDDVISLCELVMSNDNVHNKTLNVCTGEVVSVAEIYEIIAQYLNSNIKPLYNEAKDFWKKYPALYEGKMILKNSILEDEVNKYALGSNSIAKSLGWKPKYNIKQGLEECCKYAEKIFGGQR